MARAGRLIKLVADRAVLSRIRDGRLRDVGWPRGLRAVVTIACGLIAVSCLTSFVSGWLRSRGELNVPATASSSVPADVVWLMIALLVVTLALGQTAALHAPWWLTVVGTAICVLIMGQFGLRWELASTPIAPIVVALLMAAVIGFSIGRRRRRFAWWEFPVLLAVIGGAMALGMGDLAASSRFIGAEFLPDLARGTVQAMMVLALPAAVAAGTAVAEVTVGVTVAAAAVAERRPGRRWPYVVLAALVLVRSAEMGWRLTHLDPIRQGWLALIPAVAVLLAFGLVVAIVHRTGRGSAAPVRVAALPEELGHIALPIGAVLVGLAVPLLALAAGYSILVALDPTGPLGHGSLDAVTAISEWTDAVRLGLAAVLVVPAVRLARRGRTTRAVLFGCIAITLAATSMRVLTGQRWAIWFDPDSINLLASAAVFGVLGWFGLRRRLTTQRAVAGAALLVLSLLFSLRQFLGDPVGELVGYSGIGLVIFGLLWDFLTGAEWGNGDSRRFPRPTRVLLVLTNTVLLAVVVTYASLVRDAGFSVDDFVALGDQVLGVALLAAAFAVVLRALLRDDGLY